MSSDLLKTHPHARMQLLSRCAHVLASLSARARCVGSIVRGVPLRAVQVTSGTDIDEAKEQEIFEFPWVVFDVESKSVVDEQVKYIKPTVHEQVGGECVKAALGDNAEAAMKSAGTLQQAVQVCCRLSGDAQQHACWSLALLTSFVPVCRSSTTTLTGLSL